MILVKDSDWSPVEDRPCKVMSFAPNGPNGARAIIALDSPNLPSDTAGAIFHKRDFENLQTAFAQGDDTVVVVEWSKRHLTGLRKLFAPFMPRLFIMVFHPEAYELMANPNLRPELRGEERFLAERPLMMLEPF